MNFLSTLPLRVGCLKGISLNGSFKKEQNLVHAQFIPFNAARSIVKWDEKKAEKK